MLLSDHGLTEEQRMMRDVCRAFVDDHVIPFIRQNWQREWILTPEDRLPRKILEVADEIGIRTLGVPEEFGGTPLDAKTQVQTFSLIAEEIARGDSGLADKLVQVWKVSTLLKNIAPRHLQEYWFPKIVADPGFLLAHCATEPRGASDRWLGYDTPETAFQTKAVLQGNEWVINGRILKVCQHAVELHGGNGTMLDFSIEKLYRDATMFLHMDGTVDITRFKIIKSMFPQTAGAYAGVEQ